eukprot:TRINITY_DN4635_c1_g2_i1.p1 TRINITY_DN4635_c1_g2~~TRINITY_DN4635_c1_g2_i1.p1  ORF type:complete len:175 (+),score=27.34 TRINITY_DN4635_c1_g2_i1:124-648(+)
MGCLGSKEKTQPPTAADGWVEVVAGESKSRRRQKDCSQLELTERSSVKRRRKKRKKKPGSSDNQGHTEGPKKEQDHTNNKLIVPENKEAEPDLASQPIMTTEGLVGRKRARVNEWVLSQPRYLFVDPALHYEKLEMSAARAAAHSSPPSPNREEPKPDFPAAENNGKPHLSGEK